jgi:hypothetical protein
MESAASARTDTDQFDCFISYNRKDRELVRHVDERLRAEAALRPWLDEYTIPGGELFEPFIRQALARCSTCAIFLGPHAWGEFHRKESDIALELREKAGLKIIVVILPDTPEAEKRAP